MPRPGGTVVLVLQRRSSQAGAQTCLARLLRQPAMRALSPLLLCSETGWLVDEMRRNGIEAWIEAYPAVRSLTGRLFANRAFVTRVASRLVALGKKPAVVVGNDYQEAPLVLALARRLGAKSALFLRASGMSLRDYEKYGCARLDMLMPIGADLANRIGNWGYAGVLLPSNDGLEASEFRPPPDIIGPARRFLVIGTPHPDKGWSDLFEAMDRLERRGRLPADAGFDFTGDLAAARLRESAARRSVGRQDGLVERLAQYDCVIHPSRRESFGMAAMESVAAGMPLLSSRTGVAAQVIDDPRWLFRPGDTEDLARVLGAALVDGVADAAQRATMQDRLRALYPIEAQATSLLAAWAPWYEYEPQEGKMIHV